jgi:formylglycine-generating enzyme required for sulfatase activity
MGWYDRNSGDTTHPVKRQHPNAWGIFDMHGNVWEWVWDRYGGYPGGLAADPKGSEEGADRVLRGGSWFGGVRVCRAANRGFGEPGYCDRYIGFRLARSVTLGP